MKEGREEEAHNNAEEVDCDCGETAWMSRGNGMAIAPAKSDQEQSEEDSAEQMRPDVDWRRTKSGDRPCFKYLMVAYSFHCEASRYFPKTSYMKMKYAYSAQNQEVHGLTRSINGPVAGDDVFIIPKILNAFLYHCQSPTNLCHSAKAANISKRDLCEIIHVQRSFHSSRVSEAAASL